RVEEQPRLIRAWARLVLQEEPRGETDTRVPHLVEGFRCPARLEAERHRMLPRWTRVPAELRDPELDRMRGRNAVKLHGSLEERPHLREVAERDVILALRVAEGAAERVRVVRPDVELNLRRARRMRVLPLREA